MNCKIMTSWNNYANALKMKDSTLNQCAHLKKDASCIKHLILAS